MGAKLVSVDGIATEVLVKRPQDAAPNEIAAEGGFWSPAKIADFVQLSTRTLPAGSVVSITIRIGDPPQGTD